MFTLIHKLSISKLINCKIIHQWNKSVRQYYLSHWSLWAGEMTEPWQTDWEQRGLDTDLAAHMKLAATLLITSTVRLVLVLKTMGPGLCLDGRTPTLIMETSYFCVIIWVPRQSKLLRRPLRKREVWV